MPRGCQGAKCATEFELYARSLASSPMLHRVLAAKISVTPQFTVAMNSIAAPNDYDEPYRFLPEDKGLDVEFTDFASWFSGGVGPMGLAKYEGEVVLNPEWGKSTTKFVPLYPNQPEFFPAYQELSLLFQFKLILPGLFKKEVIHIFNKEPMRFITEEPLDGFPPFEGPDFISLGPVEMYDVQNPQGEPVGRFGKGRIIPIASVKYAIELGEMNVSDDKKSFSGDVLVRRTDGEKNVETAIMLRPYPGCTLESESNTKTSVSSDPVKVPFSISTSEHVGNPGVFIRVASIDTEHLGFDREDITFPTEKNFLLKATPLRRMRRKSGELITITTNDIQSMSFIADDSKGTVQDYCVSPHGIAHTVKDGYIECLLPIVSEPQEIWFTHFKVVNGIRKKPDIVRIVIEP